MSSAARPNVIFIIMDDLAFGDLSCHGNPHLQTPHLDALRAGGISLTGTCSGPVCTPARASVMTGRYAYRTRAIDTYNGRSTMDPGERTLAQVLAEAGYATCISGKWHLGDNYPSRAMDLGFQEALVHNGGGLRQPGNYGFWEQQDSYTDPLLSHNGHLVKRQGYCTDIFFEHAMAYITEHRAAPFFVYLATNAPHTPLDVDEAWYGPLMAKGLPEKLARVYGMVANIDWNVGRLMAKLRDLKLDDNTLVVYTSDHGPCGSASIDGKPRFNSGLRSTKGTPYQGGVKVPSFWHWPAELPAGRVLDQPTGPIDVLPTIAAATGAKVPNDRQIDGVNLLPLMTGATPPADWPERTLFLQWHRGNVPVPWTGCLVRTQRWKLINGAELYDLQADPGESTNVATQNPAVVAELRQRYEAWFADVGHTRPNNYAAPPVHLGTAAESPTILNRNDRRTHAADSWAEDETHGHWDVKFTRAADASYQFTVEYPPITGPGELVLCADPVTTVHAVPAGSRSATLPPLAVPPGDGCVSAWVHADGKRLGARYVLCE